MPLYNASATSINKPVLTPGRPITVWNNETVVVASPPSPAEEMNSQQVSLHRDGYDPCCLSVEIEFGSPPGAFQIDLQVADTDQSKYYVTKASLTTGLNESLVGRIEVTNVVAKFARLHMVANPNSAPVTARFF